MTHGVHALDRADDTERSGHQPQGRGDLIARLVLWPVLALFVGVVVVFYLAFSTIRVDGDSMLPTLEHGDRVLITKSYPQPDRGDIVVADIGSGGREEGIIKRVIGLPGDTVEVRDDVVVVNGVPEDIRRLIRRPGAGENRDPLVIPDGYVMVYGDNRAISLDSRFIGPVALERVRGRLVYIFWPIPEMGPLR